LIPPFELKDYEWDWVLMGIKGRVEMVEEKWWNCAILLIVGHIENKGSSFRY
jgi:hypothetical protein